MNLNVPRPSVSNPGGSLLSSATASEIEQSQPGRALPKLDIPSIAEMQSGNRPQQESSPVGFTLSWMSYRRYPYVAFDGRLKGRQVVFADRVALKQMSWDFQYLVDDDPEFRRPGRLMLHRWSQKSPYSRVSIAVLQVGDAIIDWQATMEEAMRLYGFKHGKGAGSISEMHKEVRFTWHRLSRLPA